MKDKKRVIKFRLGIGNEIVGYEKWVKVRGSNSKWFYCKDPNGSSPDFIWTPNFIYHTDKDQFTGLSDKNGKEIYEGDVCRNEYGWIGSIVFDSDIPVGKTCLFIGWWWKCREKRDGKFPFHVDKKTVILGNKFENPELLKEKK